MKLKLSLLLLTFFAFQYGKTQSVEELYEKEDFPALIEFAEKADDLTPRELYCVGYACFIQEEDVKAIQMYDKAIEKGLDEDYIYLFKGLALRYNLQYEEAIRNFKMAIDRNPTSQKNYTELANCFYLQEEPDSALEYFRMARELPYELGDSYLKIPLIYQVSGNYEKALEEFQISAELINKEDPAYLDILKGIGLLEYAIFGNYGKSIAAYRKVLDLTPEDFEIYRVLIKVCYAGEEYEKGDSLFGVLKSEFEQGNLPADMMESGMIPIAVFDWKGQKVAVFRYFREPTKMLDVMYEIYLASKDGKSIERILLTEQTIQIGKAGSKHLLCEREGDGTHHTYPFGWPTDEIDFESLKEGAIRVFNGELKPSASSTVGISVPEEKSKKRKKKKKKKRK